MKSLVRDWHSTATAKKRGPEVTADRDLYIAELCRKRDRAPALSGEAMRRKAKYVIGSEGALRPQNSKVRRVVFKLP